MGSVESQQTLAALIRSVFKAHDERPCFQLLELRKKMRQKHGNLLINMTSQIVAKTPHLSPDRSGMAIVHVP
jgi:hypothetical protein